MNGFYNNLPIFTAYQRALSYAPVHLTKVDPIHRPTMALA
jgi:hypothetical protein